MKTNHHEINPSAMHNTQAQGSPFWLIESLWFDNELNPLMGPSATIAESRRQNLDFPPIANAEDFESLGDVVSQEITAQFEEEDRTRARLFQLIAPGVALIPIMGMMMKGDGFFFMNTANTARIRRAVQQAANADDIETILLHIDSPGGMVPGTHDLAAEVAKAAALKTVHAHIDDLGASAALWVASQATIITANPTAEIGSIGIVTLLTDSSKAFEMEGLKVHKVATAEDKGAGLPGIEITPEQLAAVQIRVNDFNEFFLNAVSIGRGMSMADVKKLADGNVHIAAKAKALGLIDSVMTADEALGGIVEASEGTAQASLSQRHDNARRKLALNKRK